MGFKELEKLIEKSIECINETNAMMIKIKNVMIFVNVVNIITLIVLIVLVVK